MFAPTFLKRFESGSQVVKQTADQHRDGCIAYQRKCARRAVVGERELNLSK